MSRGHTDSIGVKAWLVPGTPFSAKCYAIILPGGSNEPRGPSIDRRLRHRALPASNRLLVVSRRGPQALGELEDFLLPLSSRNGFAIFPLSVLLIGVCILIEWFSAGPASSKALPLPSNSGQRMNQHSKDSEAHRRCKGNCSHHVNILIPTPSVSEPIEYGELDCQLGG
jgi:hypothetical protein